MQPGSTITPSGQQPTPQTPDQQPTQSPEVQIHISQSQPIPPAPTPPTPAPTPTPPPTAEPTPTPSEPPVPPVASPAEPATTWQFTANDQSPADGADPYTRPNFEPISWTASEFIDHEKNHSWFFAVGGATLLIAAVAYVLTRDVVSVVVTLTAGGLLAVSGARKPHTLSFQLSDQGLQVGSKYYPFSDFKSFTVLEEGALSSIQLLPSRRFMPSLSIYYPPDQEEAIVNSLGTILPHEDRERDAVDRLMRRIKF